MADSFTYYLKLCENFIAPTLIFMGFAYLIYYTLVKFDCELSKLEEFTDLRFEVDC